MEGAEGQEQGTETPIHWDHRRSRSLIEHFKQFSWFVGNKGHQMSAEI